MKKYKHCGSEDNFDYNTVCINCGEPLPESKTKRVKTEKREKQKTDEESKKILKVVLGILPVLCIGSIAFTSLKGSTQFAIIICGLLIIFAMSLLVKMASTGNFFGIALLFLVEWTVVGFAPPIVFKEMPVPIERIWGLNSFLIVLIPTIFILILCHLYSAGLMGSKFHRAIRLAKNNGDLVCGECGSRNITVYKKGYDWNKGFWYRMFDVKGGHYLAGMDSRNAMCRCRDCGNDWDSGREFLLGEGFHLSGEKVTEKDYPYEIDNKPIKKLLVWLVIAIVVFVSINAVSWCIYENSWETVFETREYGCYSLGIKNISDENYDNVSVVVRYRTKSAGFTYTTESFSLDAGEYKGIDISTDDFAKNYDGSLTDTELMLSMESMEVEKVIYE